jgi:phage gp36-like protein
MALIFITNADFNQAIKADHLTAITDNTPSIKSTTIRASQTEIESYLRGKYDLSKLFPVITEWLIGSEYAIGAIVYDVDTLKFYTANAPISANTAIANSNWISGDPRDALMVEFMLDLTLYRIHARVAPNQIPETRIQRRDDAIDFLKRVAKYEITVGWDQELDTEPASIKWGSNTKETKIY